ncbi:hypothetical protein Scep_017757 [Stephania cephalantha]|uniref:Xyloglucan endotransglucosylase/hydrolase n=1 Tax=Stephania cephalantha TaxID=152367 RepID=A0AAP0NV85_9MAGN
MRMLKGKLLPVLAWFLMITSTTVVASSRRGVSYAPPKLKPLTGLLPHLTFSHGFKEFFGGSHIQIVDNGTSVNLILDKSSGAGFVSQNSYKYGFFSAAIKVPSGYTSGVVIAFYMSNAEMFPHAHDEIDIELLGHQKRREWILQTNIYGNGSVHTGREEKFRLWFDPTQQFHQYSIIWNHNHTVFLVDNVPIREVIYRETTFSCYPLKPMSVYCTIWDGSEWATRGGKYPVNYNYAPFVTNLRDMEMAGCSWDSKTGEPVCANNGGGASSLDPVGGEDFVKLSEEQKLGMQELRKRFMIYSYCKDKNRYKVLPPECRA